MLTQAPIYVLAFIVAIALLVVVHEYGHYAVARLCGVKVLRFAVGFGKVVWSRRFGPDGTELALCAIPLGGYVKMLDEREAPVDAADLSRAFNRQTVGKRSLIVLAGPLANLLLAMLLYWGLFMHGVEELRPILAAPVEASLAATAGVAEGDTVREVNGKAVASWESLRWEVMAAIVDGRDSALLVQARDGKLDQLELKTQGLSIDEVGSDPLRYLGLSIAPPHFPAVIGKIMPDTPAAAAGLQPDDEIVAIDGRVITLWAEVAKAASASPGQSLHLSIKRGVQQFEVVVTPRAVEEKGRTIGRIGFGVKDVPALREAMFVTLSYGPLESASRAVRQVWDSSLFTLRMMGRMLTGEVSLKNISGPVTIAEYAGQSVQLGLSYFIRFLAVISISIGVLNLLPIPVLDGGHLMYYLAEFLRGKPLSERVFEAGQRVGLTLLLLMMSIALFNDLNRQFFG